MENYTIVTGHKNPDTDSICSALAYAYVKQQLGEDVKACRAGKVSAETQFVLDYFKVEAPALIDHVDEGQNLILVDHNEVAQAVDGLNKANLLEVVDHHRLGGIVTAAPLTVRIQPVGCTATIIYQITKEKNVALTPAVAGLLFSAISSDTLYFKSPTTTPADKEAAGALAEIAGIKDPQGYALDMLQAMNTGHDGSLTTGHANSPRDMMSRLETMVMMSGMELPSRAIREQIASAINIVVQQSRLPDGSRKITSISEIIGMEHDEIVMQEIYRFNQTGIDEHGRIIGSFDPTGVRPRCLTKLQRSGVLISDEWFGKE